MTYLDKYLKLITDRGNIKLAKSVAKTAEDIGNGYLKKFSFMTHEIGLLFGNVQSGKTGQMFGVISKATDLGFPVFLLLTTDNIVLQQQTLDRVKADLPDYCICGENDDSIFLQNELMQPTIIVIKKNVRVLRKWSNVFGSTGFMRGNPLFIIDDEADAASLNTLVNRNRKSSVNKYLDTIKNDSSCSIYLQVTGTPQALYLQTQASGWQPMFTYYFRPGEGYLGGDFFFPKGKKGNCITYIDTLTNPARSVVLHHLAASAQISTSGGSVSNCLIHPSVRQAAHDRFANEIQKELDWCRENINGDCRDALRKEYESMVPQKSV